jgi:hypothetical protein
VSTFSSVLLATFVAVIVIQVINRKAGAIASVVWSLGLLGYGSYVLQQGTKIAFLGVPVKMWHFVTFMGVMLGYNVWVLVQLSKRR